MKASSVLTALLIGASTGAFAQTTTLTFTAELNGQHVPLDSVVTHNLTQGGDTTLFFPDTTLVLGNTIIGIEEIGNNQNDGFSLMQNYPNPMNGRTTVHIYLAERKDVQISISDVFGRALIQRDFKFGAGHHTFDFYPGDQSLYLLTARTEHSSQTIKMINSTAVNNDGGHGTLEYTGKRKGSKKYDPQLPTKDLGFEIGDQLQFTAYTALGIAAILDAPVDDQTYTFDFAGAGIPCPEAPTLTDVEGNVYNTVLIGSQCWMKENLKTVTYDNEVLIPNVTDQEEWSNLTTAAYTWYENDISWKDTYGALYNGYVVTDPDNDVCPSGWHVPTEADWAALFSFIGGSDDPYGNELKSCRQVDSPLGGDCNTVDHPRWNMDNQDYGTDAYGFAGTPGGFRSFSTALAFDGIGVVGYWWTSTESGTQLQSHNLHHAFGFVGGSFFTKNYAYSVRCIKD